MRIYAGSRASSVCILRFRSCPAAAAAAQCRKASAFRNLLCAKQCGLPHSMRFVKVTPDLRLRRTRAQAMHMRPHPRGKQGPAAPLMVHMGRNPLQKQRQRAATSVSHLREEGSGIGLTLFRRSIASQMASLLRYTSGGDPG